MRGAARIRISRNAGIARDGQAARGAPLPLQAKAHHERESCDGRYMLQNAASRAEYGDVVGRMPQDVAPNEHDLAVWLENNRRAFAGERVEGEVEFTVQGQQRHFFNILAPIRHGKAREHRLRCRRAQRWNEL